MDIELKAGETRHFWSGACLFTDQPRGHVYVQVPPGKYESSFAIEELKSRPFSILVVAK